MRCLMHILVTGAVLLTVSKLEGVKSTPTASETLHIFHDADQKARPPKTDDFGDLLPEGAVARIGTTRFRHGHDIRSLAISKDGTIIASGGQDRDTSARVWDAKTGKQLLAVDNQGGFVALSPDGQTLVVSGKSMIPSDAPLRVWNVKSGKELPSIIIKGNVGKPVHGTRAVAFSPKGDMLAVVTWFQDVGDAPLPVSTIRLLNVGTGQEIGDLSAAERVAAFAFSPDGRTLAVIGGNEHYLQLWETGTGKLRAKLTKVFGEHCVFDPAGKTVAVGNSEAIVLVDLETQKEGRALTGFSTK
ncbi:MAG TPA: hypothetical protein VE988_20325, partial [Gemmataceae bacterium]|nr:hypothetical protein [Gemmataceae bacterium]